MSITYNYTKKVYIPTLETTIKESAITIALDDISTINDIVYITFKTAISDEEKLILDDIVANHDPTIPDDELPLSVTLAGDNLVQSVKPYETSVDNRKILVPPPCDRTTWYQNSLYVEDEIATADSTYTTYTLSHQNIINIQSSYLTIRQDSILDKNGTFINSSKYNVIVKVNDIIITDEDYTIDYRAGEITFKNALTSDDIVKVSYYYENGAVYTLRPPVGKTIRILRSRLLMSIASKEFVSPMYFIIFAGHPYYDYDNYFGLPPFTQFYFKYRSLHDFMVDSDDSKILKLAPYNYDILDVHLNYDRTIVLDSRYYTEARIGVMGDVEMSDLEIFNLHMSIEIVDNE